ncbi:MAG: type 1 glutamine amidotransferase domain-containing protein [Ramlibacter sp.]
MAQSGQDLSGCKVAILVVDGFEQVEMTEPRKALQQAGAQTTLVSQKRGQVQGFNHTDKADRFDVEATFDECKPEEFDAVLLPGGAVNADALRIVPQAQKFVQTIEQAGKPIAVICHGGWLLVSAGLVKGRTLTSWPTLQDDVRNAGGTWVDREVVRDGNWVSSRKPDDIPAFNREMVQLFASMRQGEAAH